MTQQEQETKPPPPRNIEREHKAMVSLLRAVQVYFDSAGQMSGPQLFVTRLAIIAAIKDAMQIITGHADPQPGEEDQPL